MPSVKDFKKNAKATSAENSSQESVTARPKNARRPGKESTESDIKVVEVEEGVVRSAHSEQGEESIAEPSSEASSTADASEVRFEKTSTTEAPKVEISFYGSEVLRARFPKPFDVAESIATDWVNDGKFEGLPVGHPLLQFAAAKGLQKAKEVEKTVMNSPVTEKIAMKVFEAGLKAQGTVQELKSQVDEIRKKVKGGK